MMLICNYERAGNKKWGPESVCRRAPTAPRRTRRERALSFIFFTFKIKKKQNEKLAFSLFLKCNASRAGFHGWLREVE